MEVIVEEEKYFRYIRVPYTVQSGITSIGKTFSHESDNIAITIVLLQLAVKVIDVVPERSDDVVVLLREI
ncbi:MAG: hypothetical protein MR564_03875 [Paraprevotella sp.]|nr:hypothetical protein [Paraprevotella sp.]